MKRQSKKAFTVIELVIVIAVIAILAAVLIPTFGAIISEANDTAAEKELRDIQLTLEMKLSVSNPWDFKDVNGIETTIGRNADGTLWAEYAEDEELSLSKALNICPELDAYDRFTQDGADLIYTTPNRMGKAVWKNIIGEKPTESQPSTDTGGNNGESQQPTVEYGEIDTDASEGLELTYYESLDVYYVTGIGDCTATDIVIPRYYQKKPVKGIAAYAFRDNHDITSVTITENITVVGVGAFTGCIHLTEATFENFPEGVSGTKKIQVAAFADCINLTKVTLPYSISEISGRLFYNCRKLKEITIPDGVTEICGSAFEKCQSLTEVKIPEGVTEIEANAFIQCTSLTTVTLPESLERIQSFAFAWCDVLGEIEYAGTKDQWDNYVKRFNYSFTSTITIYAKDKTFPHIDINH